MKKFSFAGRLLILVLAVALLCGCGKTPEETAPAEVPTAPVTEAPAQTTAATEKAQTGLEVLSREEQGDVVVVTTSYGTLRFPFAFADLIRIYPETEGEISSLTFVAEISGKEHSLFALFFGGEEGAIPLGTLTVDGVEKKVFAAISAPDEAALGEGMSTFLAAQESFNDVVVSLGENPNFKAAE